MTKLKIAAFNLCKKDSAIIGDNQGCKRCIAFSDCTKYQTYLDKFVLPVMKDLRKT